MRHGLRSALGLGVWCLGVLTGYAAEPTATPIELLKVMKGFKVELLYSVPKDQQGSWVNLCTDPKGRLIVSDQYGGLFRVTLAAEGAPVTDVKIEPIPVDIGEAQGLVWAFDSLYVVVNSAGGKYQPGVYRVTDTNADDILDTVALLRTLGEKTGEHGPHAIVPTPDRKGLYVVVGNQVPLIKFEKTKVPPVWGEDHLLPRMPDGRGFMKGVLGPGGAIYKIDPEGKVWELISVGYRNQYDAAVNRDGELFTYDADMEWDVSTPWYRPTRVCHVVAGSEYGWRNGAGKWPAYYVDSTPPVVNIGPGSPTGVTFGYGAKFPAKYQEAFFICDWSYGKLYAVHLQPFQSTYTATFEEFVTGTPLPLTDVVIRPQDGAMYFTIGGRKTQSGLYKVTYVGGESTEPFEPEDDLIGSIYRQLRGLLETQMGKPMKNAVGFAWPYLGHSDRMIRNAARSVLEFQPVEEWKARALTEADPASAIQALLALVRVTGSDPFHRPAGAPAPTPEQLSEVLAALNRIEWGGLSPSQKLDLARVYQVALNRLGPPDVETQKQLITKFDGLLPADNPQLNAELGNLLVYVQGPSAAPKLVSLLESGATQEEQIEYARALRVLKAGWTPELRRKYFEWFVKAAGYRGGNSFALFVLNIKNDAIATLTPEELTALKPILEAQPPAQITQPVAPPRPFVKEWKLDELVEKTQGGLKGRNFERGKAMFAAANCFSCHRYDNQGGALGPDLTGVAGRFSPRDLLESIIEPSKVISDQYAAITVTTVDGQSVTGRIVNLNGDNMTLSTNMLDPNQLVQVDRRKIEEMVPSTTSMMPNGLLNTLNEDEILDLLAYALSRGDRTSGMFVGK